jgi:hypothetical protein
MTTLALNRTSPSVVGLDTPLSSPPGLKPANTQQNAGSLYHTCRYVLDRLAVVEGMTDCIDSVMLEEEKLDVNNCDPLTKLTLLCRRGYPLCKLYNALNPNKPLSEDRVPKLTMTNSCKANVYHFIVACRDQLSFPEDDMFTISDLYQDDTNGFVKVNLSFFSYFSNSNLYCNKKKFNYIITLNYLYYKKNFNFICLLIRLLLSFCLSSISVLLTTTTTINNDKNKYKKRLSTLLVDSYNYWKIVVSLQSALPIGTLTPTHLETPATKLF